MSSTWRRVFIHLVWATGDRVPLIDPGREAMIGRIIGSRARKARCELLGIGCSDDHLHALVSLHMSAPIAGLVRQFKSATSKAIDRHAPAEIPFRWQRGYAALSVDRRDAPAVRAYVVRQREHHRTGELNSEWEPPLGVLDEGEDADASE